jgi:UDP-N-acetylmuramoyl-L-alanyl-D-glutamate--2,6-diaminopimelate ligase
MKLENIIESVNVCEIKGNVDKEIAGIQMDSRLVEAGHLFVAVKGTQTDVDGFNDIFQFHVFMLFLLP